MAERLGYESAWIADSQMIWSDCYATLALAADRTSRIRLGSGVAIAGTRIAPVTASAIGTINRLAPGRTFLALGTGDTSMRTMGQEPMRLGEFTRYARNVRDLLDGENTSFTFGGTRDVRLLHQTQGYIQIEPRVPLHIAGSGPGSQGLAGALGDGLVGGGTAPARIRASIANVQEGAKRSGRELPVRRGPR
jgi:alkanesulfonate monooxygenase SsuD/methylene tetrahydromethanopterin reductase-like flavin-dependent oxidoreductase (luciferase family)